MNKTAHPYYIFEVNCPLKMANGECQADSDCTSCQGKGKRRRITWLPEVQPDDYKKKYPEIEGSRCLVYYNNQEWYLETWLKKYGNAPVDRTLEEIEMKQNCKIIQEYLKPSSKEFLNYLTAFPDVASLNWLLTALIQEKT